MSIGYRAIEAKRDKERGVITELSKDYGISRTFVYMLRDRLISVSPDIFFPNKKRESSKKKELIESILSYRLEGGMSIGAISTVMKRQGLEYSGKSTISQSLSKIGALIPSVASLGIEKELKRTALLDEIFIGSQPILITVEPISSAILNIELADNRKGKTWEKHINHITDKKNIEIINTVTDEGSGILLGIRNGLPHAHRQADTFHALSHRLGIWVHRLESKAYSAIENEYEREIVCLNRKSIESFEKKRELYEERCSQTIKTIELYENFKYLYTYAIKQLNPFRSNGELRNMKNAKEEIKVALELIETLEHKMINSEIEGIKKVLPNLLDYFKDAKKAIENCKALGVDNETIRILSLEWQWNKALIKAKNQERRRKAKEELTRYSLIAKQMLWEGYERVKENVFTKLDTIIQASSMVENINSLLRPYLDRSKNQVTQEFLNLFAFYHNHRTYKRGKRVGKTPMEILTGNTQDKDWIELLIERIESKEAHFFS